MIYCVQLSTVRLHFILEFIALHSLYDKLLKMLYFIKVLKYKGTSETLMMMIFGKHNESKSYFNTDIGS